MPRGARAGAVVAALFGRWVRAASPAPARSVALGVYEQWSGEAAALTHCSAWLSGERLVLTELHRLA